MKEFNTGWFDTNVSGLQARLSANVGRSLTNISITWICYMRLLENSHISSPIYIDVVVNNMGRIKAIGDTTWDSNTEHSVSGLISFEDSSAGAETLVFNSASNIATAAIVFENQTLDIDWEEYNPDDTSETLMPFKTIFTTEEYLETHKALTPRSNVCNNSW